MEMRAMLLHLSGWERFDAFGRFFWQKRKTSFDCETLGLCSMALWVHT
jgi:hypothetical protein